MRHFAKKTVRHRLQRSYLFRAQAVFFGRIGVYVLYLLLYIVSFTSKSVDFPHSIYDLAIIFFALMYTQICYIKKYHKYWCLIALIFDLLIQIYFTKNSMFLLSPLMAIQPLFTAMFILLFHNPFFTIIPLLSLPIATVLTFITNKNLSFMHIISYLILFCTLDMLIIFFIHMVHQREQRIMYILVGVEKKLQALAILKERQRFAQDFHDGIGSQLTSVIMQVDYLQLNLKPEEPLYAELSDIKSGTLYSIDDMRRSIAFLQDDFDIAEQIALLCENIRERHRMIVQTYGIYHLADLKPEQQVNCCRIVQESLNNILKHAQASIITVRCLRDHGLIKLTIEDNGIGFSINKGAHRNHYGLTNMYDRAQKIGGALLIVSEANCGTQVELSIAC